MMQYLGVVEQRTNEILQASLLTHPRPRSHVATP